MIGASIDTRDSFSYLCIVNITDLKKRGIVAMKLTSKPFEAFKICKFTQICLIFQEPELKTPKPLSQIFVIYTTIIVPDTR